MLKALLPPLVLALQPRKREEYGWFGEYLSWKQALAECTGYDAAQIFEKVRSAALQVRNGSAAFERDAVVFDKNEYSWPLLSCLMWIAARNKGALRVLDFGGGLGSTYFQNRKFLNALQVEWSIVEQKHFVDCGIEFFSDNVLRFHADFESCFLKQQPDTVLFCSVLQYIEKPYNLLKQVFSKGFKYVVIDRTPFTDDGSSRLTIQRVNPQIYEASYPCWFFSEDEFVQFFSHEFNLVEEFVSPDKANFPSTFKGFLFCKK